MSPLFCRTVPIHARGWSKQAASSKCTTIKSQLNAELLIISFERENPLCQTDQRESEVVPTLLIYKARNSPGPEYSLIWCYKLGQTCFPSLPFSSALKWIRFRINYSCPGLLLSVILTPMFNFLMFNFDLRSFMCICFKYFKLFSFKKKNVFMLEEAIKIKFFLPWIYEP